MKRTCFASLCALLISMSVVPAQDSPDQVTSDGGLRLLVRVRSRHIDYFEACVPIRVKEPFTVTQSSQSVPAKRKYNYAGKIESKYDKSKDVTVVFFKLMPITGGRNLEWEGTIAVSDERLDFSMYFTYPGQKFATPKSVGMGIASLIYEPKQYGDYTLTIVRDNQAINVGTMTVRNRGETRRSPQRPTVKFQLLEASIPYEEFLSIANAKKVKLRIGHREFPLDPENLEAIRDLASRTAP